MIGQLIYALCALTSLTAAVLLLRGWRRGGPRLLLWSGVCFVGLFANNLLLVIDHVVFPQADLTLWRLGSALVAVLPLLYGLIYDDE
jgi:hypothetical protein